jgi:hypothetical protein
MLQCGPWPMGGGDSPEFRRSGGCGRSGVGAGWSRGHLGSIPMLSWGGAAPVGLRGGGRDGLKTGEGRNEAGQGAAARAPVGPRGGSKVAGWRRPRARGPLGARKWHGRRQRTGRRQAGGASARGKGTAFIVDARAY